MMFNHLYLSRVPLQGPWIQLFSFNSLNLSVLKLFLFSTHLAAQNGRYNNFTFTLILKAGVHQIKYHPNTIFLGDPNQCFKMHTSQTNLKLTLCMRMCVF